MKAEKSAAAVELGRRRMSKLSAEERKAFSLLGVKARSGGSAKSKPRKKKQR